MLAAFLHATALIDHSPHTYSMPVFHSSGPAEADLLFPASGQPQGFATLATTQWDGNPEPVVRELLQNSLDAAKRAGRDCCEVSFTIQNVAQGAIPGINAYRRHFDQAVIERKNKPKGAAEKTIVSRIKRVIEGTSVPILMCSDNGIGLNEDRMGRLLTEGNTDKEDAGAGAFGVGHLTAFAASDTRYVLYAGRYRNGRGSHSIVSSAHAILASRRVEDRNGIRGLGAHGYWLARHGQSGEQLGLFDPKYPDCAPWLLDVELRRIPDTGSVVCITGFNGFRNERDSPLDAIARVAAKNFLVAIQRQEMVVRICDQGDTVQHHVVDAHGLDTILRKVRKQKRTKSGWLPGEQAYRCLRTMVEGETIGLACGATAHVRMLGSSEGTSSHVQIFRSGMWITNRADELTSPYFAEYNPFDAVVMINDDSEIGVLIREAEGPEHRGLNRRRLRDTKRKRRLLHMLREIKEELQEHAGRIPKTKDYTPEDFAIFGGGRERIAEEVRRYRPRGELPASGKNPNSTTPQPSEEEGGGSIDARRRKPKGRGGGAKPKPGNSVPGRLAVVAEPGRDGQVDTLRVYWKRKGGQRRRRGRLCARVRIPSGSDSTCELPVGPQWAAHTGLPFDRARRRSIARRQQFRGRAAPRGRPIYAAAGRSDSGV